MRHYFKFNGVEATEKAPVELDNSGGGGAVNFYSNVLDCNRQDDFGLMLYAVAKLISGSGSLLVNVEVCGAEDPINDWSPFVDFASSDDITISLASNPVGGIKTFPLTSGLGLIPGFARLRVNVPASTKVQMYSALHFSED